MFYIGLIMQLSGFAMVGLCLFSGLTTGDYGKVELLQFVAGMCVFYFGHFLRIKSSAQ